MHMFNIFLIIIDLESLENSTALILLILILKTMSSSLVQLVFFFFYNLKYLMNSLIDSIGARGKVVQNEEIYHMI